MLCVMRADGTRHRDLYDADNDWEELFPVHIGWTPDSRYILFWRVTYRAGSANLDGSDLLAIRPTGGEPHRITLPYRLSDDRDRLTVMQDASQIAFSPDGRRIAFEMDRPPGVAPRRGCDRLQVPCEPPLGDESRRQ